MNRKSIPVLYVGGALAMAAGLILALRIGSGEVPIAWSGVWRWLTGGEVEASHAQVLRMIRLPRAIMAMLAGAVLACAGMIYQGLLRNPLAEPYTLGVAGGATFGAVVAIALSGALTAGESSGALPVIALAALGGSIVSVIFIFVLARGVGDFSTSTIVLAGVTLNLIFSSLILLVEYLADFTQVYEMIRWMMGGLDIVGYDYFKLLGPVAAAGLIYTLFSIRDLDALAVDPVAAASLGVRVGRVRWGLLLAASLMTGCVVAFVGPIGFVGLIVPHAVRTLVGASHARVFPATIAAGALFLLTCDLVAQNILGREELPVGVLTAMLGGPFFVYLLLRRHSRAVWID